MNFKSDVISILNKYKGQWPRVANEAQVSYAWITKMAHDRIKNPQLKNIERILNWYRKQTG